MRTLGVLAVPHLTKIDMCTVLVRGVQEFIDRQAKANRRVLGSVRELVSKLMLESDIEKHSMLSIHVHVYPTEHMCIQHTHTTTHTDEKNNSP